MAEADFNGTDPNRPATCGGVWPMDVWTRACGTLVRHATAWIWLFLILGAAARITRFALDFPPRFRRGVPGGQPDRQGISRPARPAELRTGVSPLVLVGANGLCEALRVQRVRLAPATAGGRAGEPGGLLAPRPTTLLRSDAGAFGGHFRRLVSEHPLLGRSQAVRGRRAGGASTAGGDRRVAAAS